MIKFDEALNIVMTSAITLEEESVPLQEACGRVLYRDVSSDIDIPPFDKSAMDGYSCRLDDLDKPLKVIETIPAGYTPQKTVGEGECSKIMTGGIVPEGADCVVMIEHTEIKDDLVIVNKKSSDRNICYKAEDIHKGDRVLQKGTLVTPAEVAVLASVGCDSVAVSRKPVLGIIATGNELVEPSQEPKSAQIRNSNSYQLYSQIEQAGCKPVYLGIIEDSPEAIGAAIDQNISNVDIFLLSGGVSMGEFDYVPGVLQEKGFMLLFQKVAIKPGKPTVFGKKENKFVFGMPGNPVSTFIIFEMLVKPFCYKLMGANYSYKMVKAKLAETIKRKKSERLSFIPVVVNKNGEIGLVKYHGSAHIHSLTKANGILSIPVSVNEIKAGESVSVIFI